tara:strand:+ start:957 stop:2081 length:1125 start_codon:yes stop_codon:yes gene_type:complete
MESTIDDPDMVLNNYLTSIADTEGDMVQGTELPSSPPIPTPPPPEFEHFMKLPVEIRGYIYEFALFTGQIIRPQLCDHSGMTLNNANEIKFHDQVQHSRLHPNHAAISNLLGITRVSKQIRAESLPCFYAANTFAIGADTATYFMRLKQLSRFHMVRHVRLTIELRREKWTAEILQHLTHHLRDVEAYESWYQGEQDTRIYLCNHPHYIAGGVPELALFSCLRMLTSTFTTPTTESNSNSKSNTAYTHNLVLPIPSTRTFTAYASLRWFLTVSAALGIHVHFLEGHALVYNDQGRIGVVWRQAFQKKNFDVSAKEGGGKGNGKGNGGVDVWDRALAANPAVGDMQRDRYERTAYMRVSCDGLGYEWFDVWHLEQ